MRGGNYFSCLKEFEHIKPEYNKRLSNSTRQRWKSRKSSKLEIN